MKKSIFLLVLMALFLWQCAPEEAKLPPQAPIDVVTDTYFGVTLEDPYRYMEDLSDTAVQDWFKAQGDYAREIVNSIPGRQGLIDKMIEFDKRKSSRVSSLNITENDIYFYLKTTPKDETGKLYMREGFEGDEEMLYDPADFDPDSDQQYVISSFTPNHDGSKTTVEVSPNGSENAILMIMDVEEKEFFPEKIDRCWFAAPSWLPDNNSFLYNRLKTADLYDPERQFDSKVYLHTTGTDPSQDKHIFSREKNPELEISKVDIPIVFYDKDIKYMFGMLFTVDRRMNAYYAPTSELMNDKISWKRLAKLEDDIRWIEPTLENYYFLTAKDAPNFKIMKMPLANPDVSKATEFVAEMEGSQIEDFNLTKKGLYFTTNTDGVKAGLYFVPFNTGKAEKIKLPVAAGSLSLSTKGFKYEDVWVGVSGWTIDSKRYRYMASTGEFKQEQLSSMAEYPEYDNLVVKEIEVKSHDGVLVPLSIIHNKDVELTGDNPTLVMGYGAYGYSLTPFFSPNFMLWTNKGGVLAVAHVRGGGEKGDAWHKAGFKTTKPNTWQDLIACCEYLIEEKYTSSGNLAINGGSAGGILVGRAMTERPDLFAAAIPEVGVMNTVRTEASPNGPVNTPEFGTIADSVEAMALIEMDSYHHIEDGVKYPATMVTAGMNDPRVIAWEPAKFAARLIAANASDEPILFLVDYESGHGIGDTKTKRFEGLADMFSFALWQTGHPDFQP